MEHSTNTIVNACIRGAAHYFDIREKDVRGPGRSRRGMEHVVLPARIAVGHICSGSTFGLANAAVARIIDIDHTTLIHYQRIVRDRKERAAFLDIEFDEYIPHVLSNTREILLGDPNPKLISSKISPLAATYAETGMDAVIKRIKARDPSFIEEYRGDGSLMVYVKPGLAGWWDICAHGLISALRREYPEKETSANCRVHL